MRIPKKKYDAIEAKRRGMVDFCGAPPKPKRARGMTPAKVRKVLQDTKARLEANDWSGADARHLVGLFILLHTWCYGVAPADLHGKEFSGAMSAAKKLAREEFGGVDGTLDYLRWAWKREKERERWRRDNNGGRGGTINWRTMFVRRQLVTEYRVDRERARNA